MGWYNEEVIKFWWRSGSSEMSKMSQKKTSIIVVSCPDPDAGNDPETFHHQGSTFINAYCPYCIA